MVVILGRLGWSKAELSRRVGLHPITVYRWKVVPGPVAAYLRLADRAHLVLGDG